MGEICLRGGLDEAGQLSFAMPLRRVSGDEEWRGRSRGLPTRGRAIRRQDCRSNLSWPCWCSAGDCFELVDDVEKATDFGRLSCIVGFGMGEVQGGAVASGGLVGEASHRADCKDWSLSGFARAEAAN